MGFFDDIFNEDIIWVVILLLLVFILPQKRCEPIFKNECKDECSKQQNAKYREDIIYRSQRGQRERRRLIY